MGNFAAHHKWVVLGAWLIAIVITSGLVKELGANTSNNLELPGTDSQAATDLLAEQFPPQQNGANPIVFHARRRARSPTPRTSRRSRSPTSRMKDLPHVYSATEPVQPAGARRRSRKDERTAFIPVLLDIGNEELTEEIAQPFLDAAEPARKAGMEVAAGGPIGTELSEPATERSEVIGMVAAMVILAFTFGTLVAMGMPIDLGGARARSSGCR